MSPRFLQSYKFPQDHTKAEDIIAIAQQAYERGHLPKYGIPQDVKFITELPKTSVGKIDKKVIRDQYAQGLFA